MLTTRARAYQEKLSGMELWDGSIGEGWELEVGASEVLDGAYLGCSIAVNGVCLTVTKFTECAPPEPPAPRRAPTPAPCRGAGTCSRSASPPRRCAAQTLATSRQARK